MRRTLKARLSKLEKQSAAPRIDVLWVDIDRGDTHEGVIKAKYGDQVPPDVEPVTVSWLPQDCAPLVASEANHIARAPPLALISSRSRVVAAASRVGGSPASITTP